MYTQMYTLIWVCIFIADAKFSPGKLVQRDKIILEDAYISEAFSLQAFVPEKTTELETSTSPKTMVTAPFPKLLASDYPFEFNKEGKKYKQTKVVHCMYFV